VRDAIAVLMTAWRRPQYLKKTLNSWAAVRGIEDVPITIFLEPSDRQERMMEVIRLAQDGGLPNLEVRANPERLGVDVNIAKAAETLFRENEKLQYLIFAEEDLLVSTDVLEYFTWCDEQFRDREDVLIVNSHTKEGAEEGADPAEVILGQRFRCWVWASWRGKWNDVLFPTWDWNISTSEYPGDPCDWAWNLDLRVIPRGGFRTVLPAASRSQNIGKFEGVHQHPALHAGELNPSYCAEREPVEYRVAREEAILPPGTRKHREGLTPPQSPGELAPSTQP
jgi:hypothetical protein